MIRIKLARIDLQDLGSVYALSRLLAQSFPNPEQFVIGIHELLLNAIEHGTLDIGFAAKADLLREGRWQEEITRRLSLPENDSKEIDIVLNRDLAECRLTITDPGPGFSWQDYAGRPRTDRRPCGRGLRVVFDCKFDRIIFNSSGNEVTCIAQYDQWRDGKMAM